MTPSPLWKPPTPARGSRVAGTGSYQPGRILTNAELGLLVDTSDDWIRSRVGVETRCIADSESVADMATRAGLDALQDAGLDAADLDLIIVATVSAKDRSPSTAGRVSASIGAGSPAVFDVNAACSGFTHAMAIADQAIRAGSATTALVIGAEKLSDFTDWTDRGTCVMVGDGAGATVLTASDNPGVGPVHWGSVPALAQAVRIEEPGLRFRQEGLSVYRWAITQAAELARRTCGARSAGPAAHGLDDESISQDLGAPLGEVPGLLRTALAKLGIEPLNHAPGP